MSIPDDLVVAPEDLKYGYIVGRWVQVLADTDLDPDHKPDAKASVGTVGFNRKERTSVRVDSQQNDGTWVGVTKKSYTGTLDPSGELKLKQDNGSFVPLVVVTGAYTVTFSIAGDDGWKSFDIIVGPEHTEENPLDLLKWSPIVETPTTKLVVSEALAIRAEEAAARAEAAAALMEGGAIAEAVENYLTANPPQSYPNATTTEKGLVQLTGDLGGTAEEPTVPRLDTKAPLVHGHSISDITTLEELLNSMVLVVRHGSDGATARPNHGGVVWWIGEAEPLNATSDDVWPGGS